MRMISRKALGKVLILFLILKMYLTNIQIDMIYTTAEYCSNYIFAINDLIIA